MAIITMTERIETVVRNWTQWSPAERKRMDEIVGEVLDHARNGTGNTFVRNFYQSVIRPKLDTRDLASRYIVTASDHNGADYGFVFRKGECFKLYRYRRGNDSGRPVPVKLDYIRARLVLDTFRNSTTDVTYDLKEV